MTKTYEDFLALAEAAKPHDESGRPTAREGDWGSERQIYAQNLFFSELEKVVPKDEFEELEDYCLKATTEEMLDAGLHLLKSHLGRSAGPSR